MLAEKFFLVLETIISRTNPDGGRRPVCTENLNADVVMMKSAEYRV